jgi:hypothetical protein
MIAQWAKTFCKNDEHMVYPYFLLWWWNKINKFHMQNTTPKYNISNWHSSKALNSYSGGVSWEIGYSDWGFSWISLVPPCKFQYNTLINSWPLISKSIPILQKSITLSSMPILLRYWQQHKVDPSHPPCIVHVILHFGIWIQRTNDLRLQADCKFGSTTKLTNR